jgi:hypothetical protein
MPGVAAHSLSPMAGFVVDLTEIPPSMSRHVPHHMWASQRPWRWAGRAGPDLPGTVATGHLEARMNSSPFHFQMDFSFMF